MTVTIQTRSGKSPAEGVKRILDSVLAELDSSGGVMSEALQDVTREHFRVRFPDSRHWDPSKVSAQPAKGSEGSADVSVPGASRAYHDVTIKPVMRQAITIPMHSSAYGKKPSEVPDLFVWKSKKSGSAFLAKSEGKELILMWLLAKQAFQPQDESIMPEDGTFASMIFQRISNELKDNIE